MSMTDTVPTKYTLYTGCMIPVTSPNYEVSARKVCDFFHIELELLNAPCCGNPLKPVNLQKATAMSLYVLGLASEKGLPLMTLCSACTSSLLEAQKKVDINKSMLDQFNFDAQKIKNIKIKHFINILHEDIGVKTIKNTIKTPLPMKTAVHYGCHFHRPSSLYKKDPEYPTSLDELTEACGAHSVPYKSKSMCCGSPLIGIDSDLSLRMTAKKLTEIKEKADSLIITCPGCGFMFDGKQKSAGSLVDQSLDIPVLYYSQVLGLALGMPPGDLGFQINRVRVNSLLEKVLP
ncbi:MAG: hypothetical protein HXS46_02045 [Theionarchaea archaeon]|nr:MAG: hypothetical protein AYK18_17120 [Theionarchaea archaeon DG-70]MBU7009444.1 hypothetical protein [Theionarchaea archaeon]